VLRDDAGAGKVFVQAGLPGLFQNFIGESEVAQSQFYSDSSQSFLTAMCLIKDWY